MNLCIRIETRKQNALFTKTESGSAANPNLDLANRTSAKSYNLCNESSVLGVNQRQRAELFTFTEQTIKVGVTQHRQTRLVRHRRMK